MVIRFKYLALLFSLSIESFSQTGEILQKESELASIKSEISNLENELASKSSAEKKTFEAVENLNRQNFLINKILGELNIEIQNKENEINRIEKNMILTESEIAGLKDNYAKYIKVIYKKGQYNELESIINSSSLQQVLMRTYYLKAFSRQREKDLVKLTDKKTELIEIKSLLEKEKSEKITIVNAKDDEKKKLKEKLDQKKVILNSIKQRKSELKKHLSASLEAQKKIEKMIAQLIEEEAKKQKELELQKEKQLATIEKSGEQKNKIENETTTFDYDLNTSSFSSFNDLKGKLIWPLHKGKIIRKFGENKNKTLNTVTLNYGIDIKADKDKNVRCVCEGVIAAIDWLPGYGNVIIVSHKDDYRTVYSHVSEIFVSEGDKVKTGSVLALVDEGLDGYVLHFEIWKERNKQNPELWLAKK